MGFRFISDISNRRYFVRTAAGGQTSRMNRIFSRIVGTGSYLPTQVWSNSDVARKVDTTDEWITTMTGIRQRHVAQPWESTTDMAVAAGAEALTAAGVEA